LGLGLDGCDLENSIWEPRCCSCMEDPILCLVGSVVGLCYISIGAALLLDWYEGFLICCTGCTECTELSVQMGMNGRHYATSTKQDCHGI